MKEIEIQKDYLGDEKIETIYLGGGTPGILDAQEIENILCKIEECFHCADVREVTVEMNPDDVRSDKLKSFKKLNINRISIGIQSFFDEDLKYMNRSHSGEKARESLDMILSEDSFLVTADLIFGYPLLTLPKLEYNLNYLAGKRIPHLSTYSLTVEERTVLFNRIKRKQEQPLIPDQQVEQYNFVMDYLGKNAYEHYEISSFALKGFRAVHNMNYWLGKKYLGLGPSAHSFNTISRQWNIANNALYIQGIMENKPKYETEWLSRANTFNESVMLGLRLNKGISIQKVKDFLNIREFQDFQKGVEKIIANGMMKEEDNHYRLTREGKHYADQIASGLFIL